MGKGGGNGGGGRDIVVLAEDANEVDDGARGCALNDVRRGADVTSDRGIKRYEKENGTERY